MEQKNHITEGVIWKQLLIFFFPIPKSVKTHRSQGIKKDTRFSLVSQTVDKVILRQRKGLGNKLFITLLRKAGFACRPFLSGK